MKKWITVSVLSIILGTAIVFFLVFSRSAVPEITPEEASASVVELYGGEVEEISESENGYLVDFVRSNGHYTAAVNKESGQIESIELTESIEEPRQLSEQEAATIASELIGGTASEVRYEKRKNEYEVMVENGDQLSSVLVSGQDGEVLNVSTALNPEEAVPDEPEPIISRDEAVAIARTVLSGEVDDLEFHHTDDGGFYLVEIENDDTDEEVLVQIHAIRGEILTIQWDD